MADDAAVASPLTQFPGALGCISEDGSGGQCATGAGLAGVTGVATGPGVTPGTITLYATSPAQGTVSVLEADPVAGGIVWRQCLSAEPRAGCTTARALHGAIDAATSWDGRFVYVAARDDDAVAAFERTSTGLRQLPGERGCVAVAIAGCTAVPLLDEPVALARQVPFLYVAARRSDAVVGLEMSYDGGHLNYDGCVQNGNGAPNGCNSARGLDSPEDLVADNSLWVYVAASGSGGVVALLAGDIDPGGARGCANETGSEGCVQVSGLRGANRIAVADRARNSSDFTQVYVGGPGSGNLATLGHDDWGFHQHAALPLAPAGALALPPGPPFTQGHFSYDGGSHLYAGGDELLSFQRFDGRTDDLAPRGPTPHVPAGRIEGAVVSPDADARALYAAVPSAGAVLAFARNRPPECSTPAAAKVTGRVAAVAIPCQDPDGDPLTYRLENPPARGHVGGFLAGAAAYRGPAENLAPSQDPFSVRVSDGTDEAVVELPVDLEYIARAPLGIRILDKRARMDLSGRVGVRVSCATKAAACRTRLALRRGRPLAFHSATLRSGRTTRVRATLPRSARRSVRRHRRKGLRVTVRVTGRDGAGRQGRATRRIRVRAKPAP